MKDSATGEAVRERERGRGVKSNELQLYGLSKEALIRKIQLLSHELAIYHRAHLEAQRDTAQQQGPAEFERLRRQAIEKDLIIESLSHNQKMLKASLQQSEKTVDELRTALEGREDQIGKLKREAQIYRKRCEENEKVGGRARMEKLEASNRQLKHEINTINEQYKRMKKQNGECLAKVKILNELNHQTEQKLAEALLSQPTAFKAVESLDYKQANKQNTDSSNRTQGKYRLQVYSLKQQLKTLREQLTASEESKELLRTKLQQRQIFYSRMISLT